MAGWIGISLLAGVAGVWFDPGIWYQNIVKPAWTPPDIVFPIVWPLLYICMGIAAWIVWKKYGFAGASRELQWFGLQLTLNAAWSVIFFGAHDIGTALSEILLLWNAILFTLMLFWRRSRIAGILLIPYLVWVSFASVLNFAIWRLN